MNQINMEITDILSEDKIKELKTRKELRETLQHAFDYSQFDYEKAHIKQEWEFNEYKIQDLFNYPRNPLYHLKLKEI